MLRAINKKLYDNAKKEGLTELECRKKGDCHSVFIYQSFPNILDSNKILLPEYKEFYGFDQNKREVLIDQKWTFVTGYKRKDNVVVRNYFTPSEKGKVYSKVSGLTDEGKHRTAQDILLAQFIEGSLKIKYFNMFVPINCFDLQKSENYLEQSKNFKGLFEQKLNHKESRQADMLVEFENWNEKFGKGIVFEIYNSESIKSIKEKENDWTNGHYSYVAINIDDFNLNTEEIKENRNLELTAPFDKHKEKEVEDIKKCWINNKEKLEKLEGDYNSSVADFKETEKNIFKEREIEFNNIRKELDFFHNKTKELNSKFNTISENTNNFETQVNHVKDKIIRSIEIDTEKESQKIADEINSKIKDKLNWNVMKDIQNKVDLTVDFKHKLDKIIFNGCEKNRKFCVNIIKQKIDEYLEEKKTGVENGESKTN